MGQLHDASPLTQYLANNADSGAAHPTTAVLTGCLASLQHSFLSSLHFCRHSVSFTTSPPISLLSLGMSHLSKHPLRHLPIARYTLRLHFESIPPFSVRGGFFLTMPHIVLSSAPAAIFSRTPFSHRPAAAESCSTLPYTFCSCICPSQPFTFLSSSSSLGAVIASPLSHSASPSRRHQRVPQLPPQGDNEKLVPTSTTPPPLSPLPLPSRGGRIEQRPGSSCAYFPLIITWTSPSSLQPATC